MAGPDLNTLEAADARIDRLLGPRRTLDPSREEATGLVELYRQLAPGLPPSTASALAEGLLATADAIVEHFPDNVFWDLDALAAAAVRRSADAASLRAAFEEVVELNALFGRHTLIHFRYVHDFTYGFDWAKWVRRDPTRRAGVGPFDPEFLSALMARGHELLELIAVDDPSYPRLTQGPRNPFGFSREPTDELRLHRALAREGLVPVEAWRLDAVPVWDRPFADLRASRA